MRFRVPARRRFLLVILTAWVLSSASADRHRVLVLQSYDPGYRWSQSVERGLAAGLRTADWDLWFDYLDAKVMPEGVDPGVYDPLFRARYGALKFDLVVTVDDPAYAYFVSRRPTVFRGAPAVAVGLNEPPENRLPGVSYLIERPDFAKTLNLALEQHPRAQAVHVVLDRSVTGREIRRQIEAAALDRPVALEWIDRGSIDEVADRVRALPPSDVLAFGIYSRPEDGFQSNERILKRVRNEAGMPVYAFWRFAQEAGAFGGFLYDGEALGRETAEVVKALGADGRPEVYRDEPQGQWSFDWRGTQSFGLREDRFPPGTEFVHRPQDFWQINQTAVVGFLAGFAVLAGFTVLILFSLRAQKALVVQGEAVIATQRELMQNLGNVIESRSEETASHVQRITRLSVHLAALAGRGPGEIQQLEVCAPMHDIGKVGIPDAILKKPGPLTPEEMAVMQTHTRIGWTIFRSSGNPLIQAAARIALEHHEHWDGGGYPDGKAGEAIDPLARIVAVVDVFDALLSERTYKVGWEPGRVRDYLARQRGRMFDPELTDLFLGRFDEFLTLWRRVSED